MVITALSFRESLKAVIKLVINKVIFHLECIGQLEPESLFSELTVLSFVQEHLLFLGWLISSMNNAMSYDYV